MKRKRKSAVGLLLWVTILILLLSGCRRQCSFCGRPAVFYDQCRIHGQEIVVCPFCQVW